MCVKVLALLLLVAALPATAAEPRWIEGTLRGFPVVRDAEGHPIGEGTLTQFIEDGKLHAQGIFDLRDGRRIREEVVLEQRPRLRQLSWSWEETRGGEVLRRFAVDLTTGHATARKRTADGVDTWDDHLDGTRDGFAGVGFMYAVKGLTDRLDKGEKIELRGFGSFRVRGRGARRGRNPKTGEPVSIPAKRIPYFKAGKDLKQLINQNSQTPALAGGDNAIG